MAVFPPPLMLIDGEKSPSYHRYKLPTALEIQVGENRCTENMSVMQVCVRTHSLTHSYVFAGRGYTLEVRSI